MEVIRRTAVANNPPSMKISMNILDNDGLVEYTEKVKN